MNYLSFAGQYINKRYIVRVFMRNNDLYLEMQGGTKLVEAFGQGDDELKKCKRRLEAVRGELKEPPLKLSFIGTIE